MLVADFLSCVPWYYHSHGSGQLRENPPKGRGTGPGIGEILLIGVDVKAKANLATEMGFIAGARFVPSTRMSPILAANLGLCTGSPVLDSPDPYLSDPHLSSEANCSAGVLVCRCFRTCGGRDSSTPSPSRGKASAVWRTLHKVAADMEMASSPNL